MDEIKESPKIYIKWIIWIFIVILVLLGGIFIYFKLTQKTGCENGLCEIKTNSSYNCNINNFSMAFILVANTDLELNAERINKLNSMKALFSAEFSTESRGLASMNTSYPTFVISRQELKEFSVETITRKFYETNPDSFDFISIFAVNGAGSAIQTSHESVQNRISGIGIQVYDRTTDFGSKGRLLGVNYERDLDIQSGTGTLIHETSHQWCCYAGDSFYNIDMHTPNNNTPLGILDEFSMHFFSGLESPYKCGSPIGANYWTANGDGTFRESKDCLESEGFHPFQLYFMGLYNASNFDFNKKFTIYYSELDANSKAFPYKQVSINDIISVEGQRDCQNNLSNTFSPAPTVTSTS